MATNPMPLKGWTHMFLKTSAVWLAEEEGDPTFGKGEAVLDMA